MIREWFTKSFKHIKQKSLSEQQSQRKRHLTATNREHVECTALQSETVNNSTLSKV